MDRTEILQLRRQNKLHELVENRLKELFGKVSTELFTVKEGYGVTSGRTDTSTFSTKGKIIHVEVIASESMVFRDLNNLHQSSADLCIAVLLDEDYDPKVAKAFFNANAKNAFPVIKVSDILNSQREEYALGRLDELMQSLERLQSNTDQIVWSKLNDFTDQIKKPQSEEKYTTRHLGIFPRRNIDSFGNFKKEQEIFEKYQDIGLNVAANPFGMTFGGFWWGFSPEGKYVVFKSPAIESSTFTQLALGADGSMIFSFIDTPLPNVPNDLYATHFRKIFNPTFAFASKFYQKENYDGLVDVLAKMEGFSNIRWVEKGSENDAGYLLLHMRKFIQDKIDIPRSVIASPSLADPAGLEPFYGSLDVILSRNTNEIEWK